MNKSFLLLFFKKEAFLPNALLTFIAACFLLPSVPAAALVFYALLLPSLAARPWRPVPHDPAFWLGVALIVWSGLTLAWGRDDGGRTWSFAAATLSTLAFWLALHGRLDTPRLATALVALGTVNALAGLARMAIAPPFQPPGDTPRLHGWGITYHPVLGAAVLSVCLLTALDQAIRRPRQRRWHLLAAAIIGAAILLTKSRGPELAFTAGALTLLAAGPARRWAPALLALPAVAGATGLIRTGTSGHLAIWQATWRGIQARPWFGNGLAADLPPSLGADKRFPHDLYLSLLFYSGAVGLALFVAWATVLARQLIIRRREADTPWIAALCVNALVAGVTDFGQITKGPGPLWLILWLPAALAAGGRLSRP
jgi:O-antigen ligase